MQQKDLIIIGAGPIGLACGIAAGEAGLDYLILEKGALTNSLFRYPLFMTFFSTAEKLEIGGIPFSCTASKPGRQEALEYYRRTAQYFQLKINLYEEVLLVEKHGDRFRVQTGKGLYEAAYVIIATGFYDLPAYLNVPGEARAKVHHYYKEPHAYAFQKVIVVGAQNSAVDAALETWRRGAEVTMIIRQKEIGSRVKYWVRPDIDNRIAEGSIRAYFSSAITAIRDRHVDIATPKGNITLENDFVLAMTGYRPDIAFLQKSGIALSADGCFQPQYNPETMETNVPGLFLAGVICGGLNTHKWFIENSRIHAGQILETITGRKQRIAAAL